MRRYPPVAIMFVAVLSASSVLHADTVPQVGDTYSDSARPGEALGSAPSVRVSASMTGFVRFDLSAIPGGATVSRATLSLLPGRVTAAGVVSVHAVTAVWTEDTLTHAGRPAWSETPVASVQIPEVPTTEPLVVDITAAVQAWLAGGNHGLALVADSAVDVDFVSKENLQTPRPAVLEIVISGAP